MLYNYVETLDIAKQAEKESVNWSTADENIIISTPKCGGKRKITKSRKVLSNESSDEDSINGSGIPIHILIFLFNFLHI